MGKVTIKEIAKKLGISRFAVSRAINGETGVSAATRRMVVETAKEMGFLPAGLKYGLNLYKTRNILGLVAEEIFTGYIFWSQIIFGVETAARKLELNFMLAVINKTQEQELIMPKALQESNVDGVVIIGDTFSDYLIPLSKYNLPVVLITANGQKYDFDSVCSMDAEGTAKAVKYLIEMGHRDIVFVGNLDYASSFRNRYFGFITVMKESGLLNEQEIKALGTDNIRCWREDEVEAKLASNHKLPTALVYANDCLAQFLLTKLLQTGKKVPEDISVIGFDNISSSEECIPPLTTLHVYKEYMGEMAVELLDRRINNPATPILNMEVGTKLIIRGSVAPPPSKV